MPTAYVSADSLSDERLDILIVGTGIIGLACAHKMQLSGRQVVLVDREGVARGASFGNAGGLAFSDILPLAVSGKLRHLPKWLLDPLGPFSVPPAYFFRVLPWLVRFWRAGWRDRVKASIAAQTALMRLASTEMVSMTAACGLGQMLRSDGSLELYESEAEFVESKPGWQARAEAGIAFEHVRGPRLADLQPGLSPRFLVGTFVPSWQTVSDPYAFASALAEHVESKGGRFVKGEIRDVTPGAQDVQIALSDGTALSAGHVVIAAGAWSKRLARPLGDTVPLETERGYNTTLPSGAFAVERQLIFGGHGFVITSLASGLRIGGAVELGGLKRPPNYSRAHAMLTKAAMFLPGLKTEDGTPWMGFRPSLPDSLPAIGVSRAFPRILYAFGHGHLGLTQSAATGRLIADLVCGRTPPIDIAPFSPQRF